MLFDKANLLYAIAAEPLISASTIEEALNTPAEALRTPVKAEASVARPPREADN